MAKPIPPSLAQLEARIMNRLQERKSGQTRELQLFCNEPPNRILAVLIPLRDQRFVTMSKSGVWTMVDEA
jgi:hypothetical protein